MKDDGLYIIHINECIQRILAYTTEGQDVFQNDIKTQDGVLRNFEIMGEAAKRVSEETCKYAPDIPWRRIAGFRDVLIHQYEGVDLDEVWQVIERDLPELKQKIEAILQKLKGKP
jgi:uncharacterized protein with HEPN domain